LNDATRILTDVELSPIYFALPHLAVETRALCNTSRMLKIREMTHVDRPVVKEIAVSTGLFGEEDWMDPDLTSLEKDHKWIVATTDDGDVKGAAYFAPELVSDRLWNTFFLAVKADSQGHGVGRFIMSYIERQARDSGIRTLIVETSNQEAYSGARTFYTSLGYVKEAEIRDYYGEGDNKIVFWKSLA